MGLRFQRKRSLLHLHNPHYERFCAFTQCRLFQSLSFQHFETSQVVVNSIH